LLLAAADFTSTVYVYIFSSVLIRRSWCVC